MEPAEHAPTPSTPRPSGPGPRPAPSVAAGTTSTAPDPSTRDAADVARDLGVDLDVGLSRAEAARRLAENGPNDLRETLPVPLWRRVLAQFQDPLVYLLLVAVAISLVAWIVEGAEGLPIDSVVILAIVILNAVLGYVQEQRAESAVAALRDMTAATSTVLRDGELRTVASAELVTGDVLVLAEGDAVGADARLFAATALRVSESSLTGESEAVTKNTRTLPEPAPLGDRLDMVFRGTAVAQGVGRAVVTSTGMGTQMGAIAEMLEATEADPTPLQREISSVSKLLGITVIAIAVVVMVTIALVNQVDELSDAVTVLLLGVSLAVAAVPEGLPAILSVVLAIGVQRLARRNAVVKKLSSVETLGSASVICSDKTGTLTKNEMTIECIVTASGRVDLTGVGYRPDGVALHKGHRLEDSRLAREARIALGGGMLANEAQLLERDGEWQIQGDPTEAAFLVAARKLDRTIEEAAHYERQGSVPFTSERKRMSVLGRRDTDGQLVLISKGAPDVLLSFCTHVVVGEDVVELDDARRERILADVEGLSAQAFRTLAVAYRPADDLEPADGSADLDESAEHDLVYVGVVGIIDPPRDEVALAVREAHRAGIRVVMITGDHPATAARIAADLGIVEPGAEALTGRELDAIDDDELTLVVRRVSIYARVAPEHKLRIVDALQPTASWWR